ncbi:MAG: FAD-binding oxidoreductase [Candidatus Pacebacteria bacterium]|nr:FAD-binding oxidoreductase [Candidatus Paceibacterota bacterium]
MKAIDNILNRITMYRLVLYELIFLLATAATLGFFGMLSYNPISIAASTAFIFFVCWATNNVFAYAFETPYNPESTWITALILALIITPPTSFFDATYIPLAFWASSIAIASKYIIAIRKKHLFNPAAFGVAATAFALGLSASWWVGTLAMAPFALVGGLLIVRKIHRFDLWWTFMLTFAAGIAYFSFDHSLDVVRSFQQSFIYAPAFFFSTIMLTEPATSPGSRLWRLLYAFGVGVCFLPNVSIGSFYFTPELALLLGNLGTYIVGSKEKLVLTLKEKLQLSHDVFEFVFQPERAFSYAPGQYMEWTLAHAHADSRSVRRYFTIASSPTDPDLRVGVKFYSPASTFKQHLYAMQPGQQLVVSQVSGDFTLPRDSRKKLVFIAGGIGITPFRSMIEYLLDVGERRDIVVLYSNKTSADAVYHELLDRAQRELGVKVVYAFSEQGSTIDAELVAKEVPDLLDRTFYISGPQGMVSAFKDMLRGMGVRRTRIKTDYFPGFA